jgi:hypothetical protein
MPADAIMISLALPDFKVTRHTSEPDHSTGFSNTWFQRTCIDISNRCSMKVLHTPWVLNRHLQECREERACPPVSRYANASSNTLASWRSAVSKPSVNQP